MKTSKSPKTQVISFSSTKKDLVETKTTKPLFSKVPKSLKQSVLIATFLLPTLGTVKTTAAEQQPLKAVVAPNYAHPTLTKTEPTVYIVKKVIA